MKGWGKKFHENCNQNRAEVAILIWAKIDFKSKKFMRVKEGHYVLIKGSMVIPVGQDMERWEPHTLLLEAENLYNISGRQFGIIDQKPLKSPYPLK